MFMLTLKQVRAGFFYVGSGRVKQNGIRTKYPRAHNFKNRSIWWNEEYEKCHGNIKIKILSEHDTSKEACTEELSVISKLGFRHNGTGFLVNRMKQAQVWDETNRNRCARHGDKHHNWGRQLSNETKLKKSQALMGANHHLYGKKLSDSWKDNIARGKIGDKNPMFGKIGKDHPNSRRVVNVKTGGIYDSVLLAAEYHGYKMKTLYNWLSGHRKNPTDLRFA